MEENLYQATAEEVRAEIQSHPKNYPLVMNFVTLKRACQYAGRMVKEKLGQIGENVDVYTLLYSFTDPNGQLRSGTHIVAGVNTLIIDPSITQFFPEERRYVFPESDYPLSILIKRPSTLR